jgi:hypothetical protein
MLYSTKTAFWQSLALKQLAMGGKGFRSPKVPLVLIFAFFADHFMVIMNWWLFVEYQGYLVGQSLVNAHISFAVIGSFFFILLASPFLFWAYRYGNQMPPKLRRNSIFLAAGISFLFHDFPLWLMELWVVWQYGWISVVQGISIFTLSFCTAIGFFGTWIGYTWKMSKVLQNWSGGTTSVGTGMIGAPSMRLQGFDTSMKI